MNAPRVDGLALAATAAILWSTSGVLGKMALAHRVAPLTLVALRSAIAFATLALGLFIVQRRLPRIARGDWAFFAAYGLLGVAAPFGLFFAALERVSVAVATALLYTFPVEHRTDKRHLFERPLTVRQEPGS